MGALQGTFIADSIVFNPGSGYGKAGNIHIADSRGLDPGENISYCTAFYAAHMLMKIKIGVKAHLVSAVFDFGNLPLLGDL